MFGSKGKTPVTRIKREPEPGSEAAGGVGDAFEDVGFLEDLNALLDKIRGTAENVTTCQVRVPLFRLRLGFRLRSHLARRGRLWHGGVLTGAAEPDRGAVLSPQAPASRAQAGQPDVVGGQDPTDRSSDRRVSIYHLLLFRGVARY